MWWILQILGCLILTIPIIFIRAYGTSLYSWLIYAFCGAGVAYWLVSKSYVLSPSFVATWFVGQTTLNIVGILVGCLIFSDNVPPLQWVGIVVSLVGGYMIIAGA